VINFIEVPKDALNTPQVIRVRPGPALRVNLVCKKYVGCNTHYWGGHTVACPMTRDCKACQAGLMPVWGGFIFVTAWNHSRVGLLALTAVVASNLLERVEGSDGLLGMKIALTRKTKAANANILTNFHGYDTDVKEETVDRLIKRVRVLFKDYDIGFPPSSS
jgi:hypothetical protein